MIKLFQSFAVGIYAARVANRLLDLGIKADRIGPDLGLILHEIELNRRSDFSPCEAAAYFFGAAISHFPRESYCLPLSQNELSLRAEIVMATWVKQRKMRPAMVSAIRKSLVEQEQPFQLP